MTFFPDHIRAGFHVEAKGVTRPLVTQVHGDAVVEIASPASARQHLLSPRPADGAFTRSSGIEIYIFTADCVPILFFTEEASGPIAAVHCGWRGAAAGIAEKAVALLSASSRRLHAAIGPSIRACCYEVREDLIEAFAAAGRPVDRFVERREGRTFLDVPQYVVREQLKAIPAERVHLEALRCTRCSQPELPSYRRNGTADPRIRAWIRKMS